MRALVLTGPEQVELQDVPAPVAGPGTVVVDVHRVGVCGTDVASYLGTMTYLQTGQASSPLRPGHEWAGVVSSVGDGVDAGWLGRRVTGDTMLGCHQCDRCARGFQHVCASRFEVGVLGRWHGALAEQLMVPASSLHALPDAVSDAAGAMVEPGANAARAVISAGVVAGQRVAVIGPGTIGLLAIAFTVQHGAEVHAIGRSERGRVLATSMGAVQYSLLADNPAGDFQVVIDTSDGAESPQLAMDLVEPGGTVVCIGLAAQPSVVDTRQAVTKDVTLIGNLSGSPAMAATIAAFADGSVNPLPLIAATLPLERAGDVLAGWRPDDIGAGPKVHFGPQAERAKILN